MGSFHLGINLLPSPVEGTKVSLKIDHIPLTVMGLNIPVEIATAGVFRKPPNSMSLSSMVVMAHFDTGATSTSIDINLAKHLNLMPIGEILQPHRCRASKNA